MHMKKTLIILLTAFLTACFPGAMKAQDYDVVDSVIVRMAPAIDSALTGKSIFSLMPQKSRGDAADVKIHQSQAILNAFNSYVDANGKSSRQGYRVRIFFDNHQSARSASERVEREFMASHPGIAAYRSYENPFFKVTVGDFRTRSEAMQLLTSIKSEFPKAFLVKENINYPAVNKSHNYVVDTVKVIRGSL